ncbi:hypothetical protein ABZ543_08055 [Streptomyces roseifaciens]
MSGFVTAHGAELPDIVVPVREAAAHQELRYALRSWCANVPHGRVWIVGHRPPWLQSVEHLPISQDGTKWKNTTAAVRAACQHPEVSRRWLLMNDDFFVMRPLPDAMPVLHRGLVTDVEQQCAGRVSNTYLRGMRETRAALEVLGHPAPLSYELHAPLPVDTAGMLHALDRVPLVDGMHKRTVYGVLNQIGGEQIEDVKVAHRGPRFPKDAVFLSTMPDSFTNGMVGHHIRKRFPRPCRYEREGVH